MCLLPGYYFQVLIYWEFRETVFPSYIKIVLDYMRMDYFFKRHNTPFVFTLYILFFWLFLCIYFVVKLKDALKCVWLVIVLNLLHMV